MQEIISIPTRIGVVIRKATFRQKKKKKSNKCNILFYSLKKGKKTSFYKKNYDENLVNRF